MKCALCGRKTNKILKIVDGVKIYECASCKLGFVEQSKIKQQNLSHLYKVSEYKKQESLFRKRSQRVVHTLHKYVSSGSVLEIGPGFGLMSSILLESGNYKLEIVEPKISPYYLKGKSYLQANSNLETFLKKKHKKYDMIIMFDVIEHLIDPFESLSKLYLLLNPSGILVIQTPNYDSLMQRLSVKWSWWMIEDHKWFFTPSSMKTLLLKTGYTIEKQSTHEDFTDFKKNLDGNWGRIGSSVIRKTLKSLYLICFTPLYFFFRGILWNQGKGGLLFVIARKKNG